MFIVRSEPLALTAGQVKHCHQTLIWHAHIQETPGGALTPQLVALAAVKHFCKTQHPSHSASAEALSKEEM